MSVTGRFRALLSITIALSLILLTGITTLTSFASTSTASPNFASISSTVFFTDSNLNALPLDGQGNPMVNANIVISQVCSSYNSKHNCLETRNSYSMVKTTPTQLLAWVNITTTLGTQAQSLRLNETLPGDWAVNPAWRTSTSAIHVYYGNTTRLNTDPEITQPSTINFLTRTPSVLRLAIPNFNSTKIGHPLLAGKSILVSVKLNCTLIGAAQRYVNYPKDYTVTAAAAAWTQKSYAGIVSTSSASATFATYATYSTPASAPPRPLLDSVLSLLPIVGFTVAVIAMGFGMVALASRRKRSRGLPTSTPQH